MDARATSEATLGGLRLGSFVAVFSAVQLASASHRADGARDMRDTVAAGAVTAGATGLRSPAVWAFGWRGSRRRRARRGVCVPPGYVTQELDRSIPPSEPREPIESETRIVTRDAGTARAARRRASARAAAPRDAARAIASFEAELRERAPRKKTRGSRGCG